MTIRASTDVPTSPIFGRIGRHRRTMLVSLSLAISLFISSTLPPPVAAHATPRLFANWAGWADSSRPTYRFEDFPTGWMRTAATSGINASGNTVYQNPVFRAWSSGQAPNVVVGMRPTPSSCAGSYSAWYGCTEIVTYYSRWRVDLSESYCWMNGSGSQTCSNKPRFDVWSVMLHEFLHVNNLGHHVPVEGWNSVMDPAFPAYPNAYWQNRAPRGHDLGQLATMYARDPCQSICPNRVEAATHESNAEANSVPVSAGSQCLVGGVGHVLYVDATQFARQADAVAIAEVVSVGKLQYSTEAGDRASCENTPGAVSIGRMIELREVRTVAGPSREGSATFKYWLPGGTIGAEQSEPHHFGLAVPDVGDHMLAFLGPKAVDLDTGPGVLEVDAFELMPVGDTGQIQTPNASENLSSTNVDAKVDPVVHTP